VSRRALRISDPNILGGARFDSSRILEPTFGTS
jgi:hypothetical protein